MFTVRRVTVDIAMSAHLVGRLQLPQAPQQLLRLRRQGVGPRRPCLREGLAGHLAGHLAGLRGPAPGHLRQRGVQRAHQAPAGHSHQGLRLEGRVFEGDLTASGAGRRGCAGRAGSQRGAAALPRAAGARGASGALPLGGWNGHLHESTCSFSATPESAGMERTSRATN